MDKINKKDLAHNLKPSGAYLDSLSDFADLLGTIKLAENAANELLIETASVTPVSYQREAQRSEFTLERTSNGVRRMPEPASAERSEVCQDDARLSEVLQDKDEDKLMDKLDALIGLANIKQNVKSLINYVKVRKLREENGLPNPPMSLHMVFMGNPGTGKTTVARILSELYRAIGALTNGQLIEVDRSGLVAGFVGQTAIKTAEVVKSALGGILFIDEAYALAPDTAGANDFGREAIETLLKMMEDNRDDLIVIVAGYSEPMERFISSNPGLESRFNRYFVFEDYDGGELYEIFSSMCSKSEYYLTSDAQEFARVFFNELYDTRDENFGNARHVRNFFENIVSIHSDRVSAFDEHTRESLTTVLSEDLEKATLM